MKTFYVASGVDADPTRKQAAEDLKLRVIACAEKLKWTVVTNTEHPLDVSTWGSCSAGCSGAGEKGMREKMHLFDVQDLMDGYASASGNGDMYLYPVSLTYDAKECVERATISFRIERL